MLAIFRRRAHTPAAIAALLVLIALTLSIADAATPPLAPASPVQQLQSRVRTSLDAIGNESPSVSQQPRFNQREELTKTFSAYSTIAAECQSAAMIAPSATSPTMNPIANAVWSRLNELTGGRVSANLSFPEQLGIANGHLVDRHVVDVKISLVVEGLRRTRLVSWRALSSC